MHWCPRRASKRLSGKNALTVTLMAISDGPVLCLGDPSYGDDIMKEVTRDLRGINYMFESSLNTSHLLFHVILPAAR